MRELCRKGFGNMPECFEKNEIKIGFKEVMHLISENKAGKIFVAEDCEDSFKAKIAEAAGGVAVETVPTMRELGKMCGIDVGASCAAVIR